MAVADIGDIGMEPKLLFNTFYTRFFDNFLITLVNYVTLSRPYTMFLD